MTSPAPGNLNVARLVADEAPKQLTAKQAERARLVEQLMAVSAEIVHLELLAAISGGTT